MKSSTAGRAALWSAVASVAVVDPHAVPVALGAAAAKEGFDLLRARMHRGSVLAYLRAASAGTHLHVGPSSTAPALVLSIGPRDMRSADGGGAERVRADEDLPHFDPGFGPGDFCIKQRPDWLAYAAAHASNWPDAEDAVSHVVQRVLEHHARHGTLCPDGYDPVAWSKTVIRNYLIDCFRRTDTQRRRLQPLVTEVIDDISDHALEQIIAGRALQFIESLDRQARLIALLRWVDGLEPKEIAEQLKMNPRSVRTSLHRTKKRMRQEFGIAGALKVLGEKA